MLRYALRYIRAMFQRSNIDSTEHARRNAMIKKRNTARVKRVLDIDH